MTSSQAVAKVRRSFDAAKAGHAGTLDPLASGVLPIALGEATKVVARAMPVAVSSFLDTPINGQSPRNFTRTKLLTSTVLTRMSAYSAMVSTGVTRAEVYS